ncbi:Predicted nucleotidyltransferase [Raineyella antarctica]|uniref:Predicted nucleotidyltransferase n=1 Tax=Raineyella antarctica TaxID=1577474 RepID=A0A1G6GEU7_9ACTN|nr:Predicted nucleotidyltransferase [Raineyella antarctica]
MERLDLTGRTDVPVREEVIAELVALSRRAGLDILIIGAAARDLVVHAPVGAAAARVTLDIDVAVAVGGPGGFTKFTADLERARGGEHTFVVFGVEVDVIPFGGIEENRSVMFSDGHQLDVNGIAEAFRSSVEVRLPAGTQVRVASLPAQAVLKVLSWRDRRYSSTKDARDLQGILSVSSEGPYGDSAWDDAAALAATDHDIILAGPYRVGRLAAAPSTGRGHRQSWRSWMTPGYAQPSRGTWGPRPAARCWMPSPRAFAAESPGFRRHCPHRAAPARRFPTRSPTGPLY